jgi:hypothetical protein
MVVRELTYYAENILNKFVFIINKGTQTSRSIMRRICWPNRLLVLTKIVTYEARGI